MSHLMWSDLTIDFQFSLKIHVLQVLSVSWDKFGDLFYKSFILLNCGTLECALLLLLMLYFQIKFYTGSMEPLKHIFISDKQSISEVE